MYFNDNPARDIRRFRCLPSNTTSRLPRCRLRLRRPRRSSLHRALLYYQSSQRLVNILQRQSSQRHLPLLISAEQHNVETSQLSTSSTSTTSQPTSSTFDIRQATRRRDYVVAYFIERFFITSLSETFTAFDIRRAIQRRDYLDTDFVCIDHVTAHSIERFFITSRSETFVTAYFVERFFITNRSETFAAFDIRRATRRRDHQDAPRDQGAKQQPFPTRRTEEGRGGDYIGPALAGLSTCLPIRSTSDQTPPYVYILRPIRRCHRFLATIRASTGLHIHVESLPARACSL